MPRLVIHHAGENARVFELLGKSPLSIGRAKSSSLVLDDSSVSRLHAVLRSTPDGRWQIIDRDSANGVKINGVATQEAVLRSSDEITLGEYRLQFEDSQARQLVSYGTTELPRRVAQVMGESAYAGSFLPVEPLAGVAGAAPPPRAELTDRVRALEHENRLLTLLYRVNRALGALTTVEELTQRILDLVLEIEGAERAYAMLLDEVSLDRGDFRKGEYGFQPAVIRYRGASGGSRDRATPQLIISQTIIRKVMQGGLPLLVSDAKTDARLSSSESIVRGGIQSAMCAPLGIGDRLRGLLYVDNLSRRGMFTVDDLNVFAVIAVQAGLAIERVRSRNEVAEPSR